MENKIKILKSTSPGMCGGTDATLDEGAPKHIECDEMALFDVSSALPYGGADQDLGYISAFAAKSGEGTFLFLETGEGFRHRDEKTYSWQYVKKDVLPELTELVKKHDLAKNNGFHSKTHGLPENFGGSVDIRYKDGERISISNNQSPVLSCDFALDTANIFKRAMQGEKIALPDVSDLKEIRFEENRSNGGFTKACLKISPDGTAENEKKSKYDGPEIYESKKPVDAETVAEIKKTVCEKGILAWAGLPDSGYSFIGDKKMTFVFGSGEEITVKYGKLLPDRIQDGFFKIELEITTKN